MQAVWTVEQARLIDEKSIAASPSKQHSLMEKAGRAVADVVIASSGANDRILILAGKGNNGGDAKVVARLLKEIRPNSIIVDVYKTRDSSLLSDAGKLIVVDGIFGIGFKPPLLDETICDYIRVINDRPNTLVIAIDIPSGLSGNSMQVDDRTKVLKADKCITFSALKPVHCYQPDLCGDVIVVDIGFDPSAVSNVRDSSLSWQFAEETLASLQAIWSKYLRHDAHKFNRGHVLVIGGSQGKFGAPLWSAGAAAASGCGWVSVAMPLSSRTRVFLPMQYTYEDLFDGNALSAKRMHSFLESRRVSAIVIGPGMNKSPGEPTIQADVWEILCDFTWRGGSVVVDAGACSGLLDRAKAKPGQTAKIIATPHPGEWQTLSLCDPVPDFNNIAKAEIILRRAQESGITLCYKGAAPTLFSSEEGKAITICKGNDPRLAKAGTGDLLAGITAALTGPSESVDHALVDAYAHLRSVADKLSAINFEYSYTAADFLRGLRCK